MRDTTDTANPPQRPDFLSALVADLSPVRPVPSTLRAVSTWAVVAVPLAASLTALGGPLRDGVLSDLSTPRLALEFVLGISALIALGIGGFEAALPGGARRAAALVPGLLLGAAWLGVALGGFGLDGPAVSMLGKREHCFLHGVAIAAVPALHGVRLVRARTVGPDPIAGLWVGLAAGALPALAMQLACMYDPGHALRFHFTPILVMGLAGAAWTSVGADRS